MILASKEAEVIGRFVEGSLNISSAVGLTVKNLVQSRKKKATENQGSVIYKIPCGACDKSYIGETFRGKDTRTKEHKSDLRHHRLSNAFVFCTTCRRGRSPSRLERSFNFV